MYEIMTFLCEVTIVFQVINGKLIFIRMKANSTESSKKLLLKFTTSKSVLKWKHTRFAPHRILCL